MRWASVTFMAMAWSGCAGQRDTLSVEQVGDTIVVTNVTPTVRDTAEFVLVMRVGRFGGGPEYEFSEITALAVDDEGGVYTFDRGAGIRSFDRSGEFRGWVARIGEGLSEVGCTQHLAVDHGTVAAYDRCNRRITLFPVEGEPHSLPTPSGLPRFGWDGLFFDEAGALWIGLTPPPPADGGLAFPRPIAARFAEDGSLRDTLFVPARYAERCPIVSEARYRAGFWEDKREQWYPKTKWAMARDGRVAYGCPRDFEIDVAAPAAPLLRFSKPWRPVTTTKDERDFYEQWWRPIPPLPESRPAYARIVLPDDGRVWVWPEQPSEHLLYDEQAQRTTGRRYGWMAGEHGAFEVFAADGRWEGTIRLPESVRYSGYPTTPPLVIRGDTMWAVLRDSLDVEYIGRFEASWVTAH